jgi:hypothetical protein
MGTKGVLGGIMGTRGYHWYLGYFGVKQGYWTQGYVGDTRRLCTFWVE